MARVTTISRRELAGMHSLLYTERAPPQEIERRKLKDLSEARVAKWPNTLAAMRKKKEEARANREAKEEAERRVSCFHGGRRAGG